MRSIWVVGLVVSSLAHAQEPAPPPADPPITLGASLTVWLPQGDADDFSESFAAEIAAAEDQLRTQPATK